MAKKNASELQKTEIDVRHDFNREELEAISNELAQALQKRKILEAELSLIKADYKSKMEVIDKDINRYGDNISQKHEIRAIPVYLYRNYSEGVRQYLSAVDKTEVIREEPLTVEDKQLKMKLDEKEEQE